MVVDATSSFISEKTQAKIKLLIVDDHTLLRETWVYLFNKDPRFVVLGACGSAEEAVGLARNMRPDIVLMDINLPGMNGIEATSIIRKMAPVTKIAGVSLHSQPSYARIMMQKGASGYITKNSTSKELMEALVEIHHGKKYICTEVKNILSQQVFSNERPDPGVNSLSQREIEIITLIKKGDSSKEIATALHISVKTVEVHRYNILKKLGLKNAAALVDYIHKSELELQ